MTVEEFNQEIENNENALVDFWAPWCGPCKMLGPIVSQLDEENPSLKVLKVNVDESMELAQSHGVRSIPTMLIFKNGKPVATKVGAGQKAMIQEWIDETIVGA